MHVSFLLSRAAGRAYSRLEACELFVPSGRALSRGWVLNRINVYVTTFINVDCPLPSSTDYHEVT